MSKTDIARIKQFYQDYEVENNSPHIVFFAKTEYVAVSIYTTGKVMFQGEDAEDEYNMWLTILNYPAAESASKKPDFKDYFYPSIGSDEVGTGDFFGPITVCAFHLNQSDIEVYKQLNIRDSKNVSDEQILIIGEAIKDMGTFSLLTLHNDKYNQLVKKGFNMNKIKAYLHNKAILNLLQKIHGSPEVIIDQFTPEKKYFQYLNTEQRVYRNITFLTKAESRYASVALASILARYAFLKHFDHLSDQVGVTLPKGAGAKVDDIAASLIKKHGEAYLENIAKTHFTTFDKAKKLAK